MFSQVDIVSKETTAKLDQSKRSALGQFFTPFGIAQFMAALFGRTAQSQIRLLDAGAGVGVLSAAFLETRSYNSLVHVHVSAFELDPQVANVLSQNFEEYAKILSQKGITLDPLVIQGDFIRDSVLRLLLNQQEPFDYAILNPPYRKINSDSEHRHLLRKVRIETVNLYSAFVALSILLLKDGGELVAIIPRSFCNGPYYKSFRAFLFEKTALKQIHIFKSRNKAFKDDGVLQENIIIHLIKGTKQGDITISTSTDETFDDLCAFQAPYSQVVKSDDPEHFIHIPLVSTFTPPGPSWPFIHTLDGLGIVVSTGPVVDFRVKSFLRQESEDNTVPLIYPGHFADKTIQWPRPGFKKPNAILVAPETQRQLFPNGFYTLVRRFSSKEEKKRIVARVITPKTQSGASLGFENHLNVFHHNKHGLPEDLAFGLAVYLNATLVDVYFREFNGHTQVNATDLRVLKYPDLNTLMALGQWSQNLKTFNQKQIDEKIETLL